MTVRYLSEDDTRKLLDWPAVIACIAAAYARADDARAAPPRVVARSGPLWLRALTAISGSGGCMGAKLIVKGRPKRADHLVALWDQQSAALACLMNAKTVTAFARPALRPARSTPWRAATCPSQSRCSAQGTRRTAM